MMETRAANAIFRVDHSRPFRKHLRHQTVYLCMLSQGAGRGSRYRDHRGASSLENGTGNVRLIPLDSGAMELNNVVLHGPGVPVGLVVMLGAAEIQYPVRGILSGI